MVRGQKRNYGQMSGGGGQRREPKKTKYSEAQLSRIEDLEQKIKEQEVIIDAAKKIIHESKAELIRVQDAGAAVYVIWCDQAATAKVPRG